MPAPFNRNGLVFFAVFVFSLFPGILCGQSAARSGPVRAQLLVETSTIQPGTPFLAGIRIEADPGWHTYWMNPGDAGLATEVDWDLPQGFSASPLIWPAPRRFSEAGLVTFGYEDSVLLQATVTPPAALPTGTDAVLRAEVSWLACKGECLPGSVLLELAIAVRPGLPERDPEMAGVFEQARPSPGIFFAIIMAFLGGILLNLMPCVLPVLSLKLTSFLRESGSEKGAAFRHGLLFSLGVLVSFWLLLGLLLALKAGGALLGWGFQFQSPAVVAATAALFLLIGLNLFGVFEVGTSFAAFGAGLRSRGSWTGAFASGFLATLVATPCTAPFMGGALGFALSSPAPAAFAVFTALGVGMSLPYLLLTSLPGLAPRLPKPGRWMETLKQAMGFLMMSAVIWMVSVIAAVAGAVAAVALLAALLAAALGAWIYGRWGGVDRPRGARIAAAAAAVALVVGATCAAAVHAERAANIAPAQAAVDARGAREPTDAWEPWSPDRLAELRGAGTPVLVDFSATWCLTCQVNERLVLRAPRVRRMLRERGVAALKADWTDRSDEIARALAAHGRAGVPLYVLYPRGGGEPVLLPELLTTGIVLRALEKLGPDPGPTSSPSS